MFALSLFSHLKNILFSATSSPACWLVNVFCCRSAVNHVSPRNNWLLFICSVWSVVWCTFLHVTIYCLFLPQALHSSLFSYATSLHLVTFVSCQCIKQRTLISKCHCSLIVCSKMLRILFRSVVDVQFSLQSPVGAAASELAAKRN